jgi:hypothetical protein
MSVPGGPCLFCEVRAGGVVAGLGAMSSTVGLATTDWVKRLPTHLASRIEELLPHRWAPPF